MTHRSCKPPDHAPRDEGRDAQGHSTSALSVSCEKFVQEMSPALAAAGARWAVVILVGYTDDDVHSLDEAADLTTDSAAGTYGTAARWLVVDTATGQSRAGSPPRTQRLDALQKLRDHYNPGPDTGYDAPSWAGEPVILVSQAMAGRQYRLVEVAGEALALRLAGEDVLEGWLPVGTFDLDTGRMTELHIATPIVTPAEDQRITVNPLET